MTSHAPGENTAGGEPRVPGEIASDVELVSGSWSVVISDHAHLHETVDELHDELEFAFHGIGRVALVDAAKGVESMLQHMAALGPEDVVLVRNIERLDLAARQQLDEKRTRFEGGPRVVIVTTEGATAALANDAPHVWSWMSSRVFAVDRDSSRLDIEQRLASLREGTGLTDDDVIRRAQTGASPLDPIHAEWLILIGRGDLIGL